MELKVYSEYTINMTISSTLSYQQYASLRGLEPCFVVQPPSKPSPSQLEINNDMLAPPPFEGIPFASSTALIVACQQFLLGEGYVTNKHSLEETRGELRLMCDHITNSPAGGQGLGLRKSLSNINYPFTINGSRNESGMWEITTIGI